MSGAVGANVLGVTLTPSVAVAGVSAETLAVTGLATGWMVHLAFFAMTLGLSMLAIVSAAGFRRRHVVLDRDGHVVASARPSP